jgi:hypothetical protein
MTPRPAPDDPNDRPARKKRVIGVLEIAVGSVLVFMRGWTFWHFLPAPWLGAFLIAFGVAMILFPGMFREL